MDPAVELVNAYLNVNGYFTVVECPVMQRSRGGEAVATDLDILALRHPHVGRTTGRTSIGAIAGCVDEALACPEGRSDMIVGEVKEGRAQLNPAARDPGVVAAALSRFGCCPAREAARIARDVVHRGRAETPGGHVVRMVAFGSSSEKLPAAHVVPLSAVTEFLERYVQEHWDSLRRVSVRQPVLSLLCLTRKASLAKPMPPLPTSSAASRDARVQRRPR